MDSFYSRPSVMPAAPFDPVQDANALRKAMKGFGTDEAKLIEVLCNRSNAQRQTIKEVYTQHLGRDLVKDMKSELSGNLERVLVGLTYSHIDYHCYQLHKAMAGMGTDELALIETLCPRSGPEMQQIVKRYEEMFNRPLVHQICTETSGNFSRLLSSIASGSRDHAMKVNPVEAKAHAEALYKAGEGKLGTDEHVFNKIFCHDSFGQLRIVFEEYKKISGRTIEQALKSELSGDYLKAAQAIVECVQSPPTYYAKSLFRAMDGVGTNDSALTRIIVSRCDIDLGNIKQEYERLYDKTLLSVVKGETSGDYKKALCALIGNA